MTLDRLSRVREAAAETEVMNDWDEGRQDMLLQCQIDDR